MAIQPSQPIVVPEKIADQLWVLGINIMAPSAQQQVKAIITVAPFISATGEILRDQQKQIVITDLYAQAAQDQVVAQGIGAIYATIQKLVLDQQLY